ncbi:MULTISPECIES: hypothetical protein [Serratia]|uniref:hypothetical protein n=1 Tax=Serratia TaxID=613 RepID=UPI0006ECFE1F|nr:MULTISPECIES: hypothetical protein [Serratia]ALL37779.1 hypothetical protein AR325_12670 [Serratia marcescens]MDK4773807.1 hypothetical protein [Serratia nevei]MDK5116883.1 hypothetical protein [Serratia nevei]MDK5167579.1 hypothetical protein [Serratia nevei]MDK5270764.1 hypothetical protein [Serratia nevei]
MTNGFHYTAEGYTMKATVLCITPSEEAVGYLTAGKQYDIESTCSDGKCVRVIDDQGDEISIFVDQSSYGKFRELPKL